MKKTLIFFTLLFCTVLNAKTACKSSCVKRIGNSLFSYNYAWYIDEGNLCTSIPWKGNYCSYAIYMNGNLIDSGFVDGSQAVTC